MIKLHNASPLRTFLKEIRVEPWWDTICIHKISFFENGQKWMWKCFGVCSGRGHDTGYFCPAFFYSHTVTIWQVGQDFSPYVTGEGGQVGAHLPLKVTDTLKLTGLAPEEKRPSPNARVLPKYTHWNLIALRCGDRSVMEAAQSRTKFYSIEKRLENSPFPPNMWAGSQKETQLGSRDSLYEAPICWCFDLGFLHWTTKQWP